MALTAHSQFGGQRAGIQLTMKHLLVHKEFRGVVWHSWAWLQDRGLPRHVEVTWCIRTVYWFIELFIKPPVTFVCQGLCSTQRASAQLQSRAQLSVDGRKLLTSGLNVSVANGRLALLLSFSPTALNQTATWPGLDTALTAQFKGQITSQRFCVWQTDQQMSVLTL